MTGKNIVIVGASRLGCQYALAARAVGHAVTLVDEHPQPLSGMSLEAPYFYGAGLPASLSDEAAMMDNVIGSNDLLMECAEADVDLRIATIAWGAFHNAENRQHIGTPKVGLVSAEGNELVEYDQLILATGSRDFVPSFQGWELPGVMGGKAACKLLDAYQVFNGTRAVVLGSTPLAMEFIRLATERGIEIAAVIEPTDRLQVNEEDRAWLEGQGIAVHYDSVILSANGTEGVTAATLAQAADGSQPFDLACDTVVVAVGTMPNVELPAAMGCDMTYNDSLASWLPVVDERLETSVPGVHWLSAYSGMPEDDAISRAMSALKNAEVSPLASADAGRPGDYARHWVERLHATGGADVVICQCETVTRAEFNGLAAPRYLKKANAAAHCPVTKGTDVPQLEQDFVKRMTRVGMGHCQGKRCRDEAAMVLASRYGIPQANIRPASYRFPVRPIDVALFAAADDDIHTRDLWPHWLQPENH